MDPREAHRRATDALDAGNAQGAVAPLWALLGRNHMSDDELRAALSLADRIYTALGRRRERGRCPARRVHQLVHAPGRQAAGGGLEVRHAGP